LLKRKQQAFPDIAMFCVLKLTAGLAFMFLNKPQTF